MISIATTLSSISLAVDTTFQSLARRQVSEALARYSAAAASPRPRNGWIAAIRESLGMTVRQLAARLGVTPSNVTRLEQRERDDTISLGALRRAANALGCDLVYAVVPRRAAATERGDRLLDTLIEERAREIATAEIRRIAHSMALEGQAVRPADLEAQIVERAAELARTPRRLWDPDVASSSEQRSTAEPEHSE